MELPAVRHFEGRAFFLSSNSQILFNADKYQPIIAYGFITKICGNYEYMNLRKVQ